MHIASTLNERHASQIPPQAFIANGYIPPPQNQAFLSLLYGRPLRKYSPPHSTESLILAAQLRLAFGFPPPYLAQGKKSKKRLQPEDIR